MDVSKLSIENDPKSNRKIINCTYRIVRKIGHGQFGKVLLAENIKNKDNSNVAIKTINRIDKTRLITKTYLSHTTKIKREIQIMKECNHPNVVKLYQVIDDLKYDKILLVLEYCPFGEIDWKKYNHYHEKYHKTNGITINKILRDVVNGLEYLHNYKKIIHRDLKPSNLLISTDRTIKISDFGVSLIRENNANDDKELGKSMGTPAFFAPELCQFVNNRLSMINDTFNAKNNINSKIDLWSLGVVLYCLIYNDLPFNGFNEFGLFKNIVNQDLRFPKIRSTNYSTAEDMKEMKLLKDLIKKLLTKDPLKRITLDKIKQHEFTLFDLTETEKQSFQNFNQQIIRQDGGITSKIKRFFNQKQESPVMPPAKIQEPNINELEQVDDLLDSYLDDSSSMGSYDDTEHATETSNVLESIESTSSDLPKVDTLALESTKPPSRKPPSPLQLDQPLFNQYNARSSSTSSQFASPLSPSSPASTTSNSVVIGASSPTSIKSMFSPSKRFFARNKSKEFASPSKSKPHTISSLSHQSSLKSHNSDKKQGIYNDFVEPPPIFGSSTPNASPNLNPSPTSSASSRKNSISSVRSNALSRITSSSSSLNLNAYLTDDVYSLPSLKDTAPDLPRNSDKSSNDSHHSEDADETLIIPDEDQSAIKQYTSMSDLLDKL